MLGKILVPGRVALLAGEGLWVLAVVAFSVAAACWNREAVFFGGEVYFADGDSYARMVRARMVGEEGLRSIRWHGWENFPDGTVPHTTMPLDALIAGMSAAMAPFTARHLELAGAWVSPLLGAAMVGFLAVWGAAVRLPWRRAMGFMAAVSPILAHGFGLGRPDHQSLLALLFAVALAAEASMWMGRGKAWGYVSAVAWGLALWVSLFEPAVLLGVVLVARAGRWVLGRRVAAGPEARPYHYGVLAGILLVGFLVDGWRVAPFHPAFERWAQNIGELRSAGLGGIFSWCGWLVVVAPVVLLWRAWRERGGICGLFAVLVLVLAGLCLWHARWGYFLAVAFAVSLPWVLGDVRWRLAGAAVFLASLWPVAGEWERMLFPEGEALRARVENVADAVALREAALVLKGEPQGGVLAPWWFSPAIVWWSGQPCVGGTSHQSLPGILESCEFYIGGGAGLRPGVKYVVAYEPERLESNSAQILGQPVPGESRARLLWKSGAGFEGMGQIFANRFFKVYRVAEPK